MTEFAVSTKSGSDRIGSRIGSRTGSRITDHGLDHVKQNFCAASLNKVYLKKQSMGPSGSFFFSFLPKNPMKSLSRLYRRVQCSATMDEGEQQVCIISLFSLEKHDTIHSCFLTSLSFFRCWRVRHIGSHNSQTDRPKCSTLQGQSLRCYSRRMTSYESL